MQGKELIKLISMYCPLLQGKLNCPGGPICPDFGNQGFLCELSANILKDFSGNVKIYLLIDFDEVYIAGFYGAFSSKEGAEKYKKLLKREYLTVREVILND